jgi:LysR family transcriptional regulator (chromosome initiation inhibitor)
MLDYKLIEALARVVQEGGFDKAARQMHLTQSAVSQRIRLLEDQAGMVLLTRTLPPEPTPEGKALLNHYIQVNQLEEDLSARLRMEGDAGGSSFRTLAVGVNSDSLATWFFPAVNGFLNDNKVLLDLRVDDQDQTHKLLRNGEVLGCISSENTPVQGCRVTPIGTMNYRMAATPEFRDRYFPQGLTRDSLRTTPAVIYNHKDDLHAVFLEKKYKASVIREVPAGYVPSPELFVEFILTGRAYGMVPDLQSLPHLKTGGLIDLDPDNHIKVALYWHRWNLGSSLLDEFSKAIVKNAVIC